eukprot:NODE_546_length_6213_cov_1.440301.p1 type:complete len:760 gc:universal NODE_546_length_6213_cov_1.440301:3536-1257(-)
MKYLLHESKEAYYLQNTQKVIKVKRNDKNLDIEIVEEPQGIKSKAFHGILGFIRFTKGYYMILITSVIPVAIIGQHYIYHIQDTQVISLSSTEGDYDENRYLSIFNDVNLNKNFYFSYSYNLSNTLQFNILNAHDSAYYPPVSKTWNSMFVWNQFLLQEVNGMNDSFYTKVIYGFVDSSKIDVFGNCVFVVLIGRRSKKFAGTRFLKRGITNEGDVANEVETEQIVIDGTHIVPNPNPPTLSSFVVHRGSIPLFWTQENLFAPKPDIRMVKLDPFYRASCKHFEHMFKRYGKKILVWNLVKSKERSPRESLLSTEFETFIEYINDILKSDYIKYTHFDLSRANKNGQDVVSMLEAMSEKSINETGMFIYENFKITSQQFGITRVSCIDCLDRTNAAQFFLGKIALGYQLHKLGLIFKPYIYFDSTVNKLLVEMFHDLGDTIALQYGGSQLVNTVNTYRQTSDWQTHSRDVIESIKRYYSNSFTDVDKQNSINLFLGYFIPRFQSYNLWDMPSDKSLHYKFFENQKLYKRASFNIVETSGEKIIRFNTNRQFVAFYKSARFSSLDKQFLFNQMSTSKINQLPRHVSPFEIVEGNSENLFFKTHPSLPLNAESEWKFYKTNWPEKGKKDKETRKLIQFKRTETDEAFEIKESAADLNLYKKHVTNYKKIGSSMVSATPIISSLDPHTDHPEFGFYKLWADYSSGDFVAVVKDQELFDRYVSVGNKIELVSSYTVDNDRGELPGWSRHYRYAQYLKNKKFKK